MGDNNSNGEVIGRESAFEGLKPAAGMVLVQVLLAGVNIFYKLALNDGMDAKILVAYRYMFAAAIICPIALFVERKKRPTLTWRVLLQAFGCGLFGATLGQNMFVASMKMTSATFASAIINLIPAMTFILAVFFRLEKLGIQTVAGRAKIAGTVTGLCGAMILTLYKGPDVNIWPTTLNLLKQNQHEGTVQHGSSSDQVAGSLLAIASCLSTSGWMIIQAKMAIAYPCHYSSAALMCLMGAIQTTIYALCLNRDMSQWRLGFNIRLLSIFYSGVVASGLVFSLIAWCIQQRGPLFASIFNPLVMVVVAVLGSLVLNEKLHFGSIVGAVLIVIGLYMVLWGKRREAKGRVGELDSESAKEPSEGLREPLEILVVDGIPISSNASLDQRASFSRNVSRSEVENASQEKSMTLKD